MGGLKRIAKHRLVGDGFRPRVENRGVFFKGFHPPGGNEAPAHWHQLAIAALIEADYVYGHSRRDVVVRLQIAGRTKDAQKLQHLGPRVTLGEPPAHFASCFSRQMRPGAASSAIVLSLFLPVKLRVVMTSALHLAIMAGKESAMPKIPTTRRDTLNLRIKPEERGLIDRAATLTGKTRTDFVLEAARQAAEEALLDRTVFTVSPEAYAKFLARLDEAPKPNERLRRTMRSSPPWE